MPSDGTARTVMWEAKAEAGREDELLAFVLAEAPPDADVYRSRDQRVVVIDRTGRGLPEPPAGLLARPAHVWRFDPVPRPD
ncbi:MAG: hypothetical protein ACTHMS_07190 [Jatrophihabitans sp.]|uniref:hypothetical protein n=1 Tax=Jatrophihabitans sp. TaxID=1932789 RepID=UPI003F7E965A